MICYVVRHGKDDDTVRGGWSAAPLTDAGFAQVRQLASQMLSEKGRGICVIYTSDLLRAKQTAGILSDALSVPIVEMPEFRETNNGLLAGMSNIAASKRYPGMYWSALDWEQSYPGGESSRQFYERIADAWYAFKEKIQREDKPVMLVTHGGVIHVIQSIEKGIPYSNKVNPFPINNAEIIEIEI